MSIKEALAETWQEQGFRGLLGHIYLLVGFETGFFEWNDARRARSYRMASGKTLEEELQARLKQHGWDLNIRWTAECYAHHVVVTAYLGQGNTRPVTFDYDHHRSVCVLNPLSAFLFPELSRPAPPRAFPVNWVGPEALK